MGILQRIVVIPGRRHRGGKVYFQPITLDMLRAIFFPRTIKEKYHYLGNVPYEYDSIHGKAILPLVLAMDAEVRKHHPNIPRWFLNFLQLFGNDNSIVRMRNARLSHLHSRLTRGIFFWDWKTKWEWYDLRISISGTNELMDMADQIERDFYNKYEEKNAGEEDETPDIS